MMASTAEDDWGDLHEDHEPLSDTGWDDMDTQEDEDAEDWPALRTSQTNMGMSMTALERQYSYEILTEEDLETRSKVLIERIKEQLYVSDTEASLLLRFYRWNAQKLLDDWLDDSDKVRGEAGLADVVQVTQSDAQKSFACTLCTDSVPMLETMSFSCNHRYCVNCWKRWVNAEFDKGPQAVFTTCPGFKCHLIIPEDMQLRLLPNEKRSQFKQWLLDGFVQGNRHLKWCPSPECDKIAEYRSGGEKEIECRCGHVFCFKCGQEGHRPCSCDLVRTWQLKNSTDSENVNWIIANTKRCPKCTVNIEKNQGCNHMTCRNCKFEFCWLCKGDWKTHGSATGGYYRCNKYEDKKAKGEATSLDAEEAKQQEARNALQKYMFYFTRFDNHQKSIAFARKTRVEAEGRMQKLRDIQGTNYQDVQFVLNAVNAVIACRRVLMWTYCYGFYLEGALEKSIFEQHQERLEKFTEHLHGLSEMPIQELLDNKIRADIVNYTRVSLRYRDNVLSAIENGLKNATMN